MTRRRLNGRSFSSLLALFLTLATYTYAASVGGTISGTVKDSSGAVIPRVAITAKNYATGFQVTVNTDEKGGYVFAELPIGTYELDFTRDGFRPYRRTSVVVDANASLRIDAVLYAGDLSDTVTVSDTAVHVETSSPQMGEIVTGQNMTAVPLNGRSFTDLLALQPGVVPATSITSSTVQDVGASAFPPSGDLNPGTISINGQREFANAFIVNGSDVEEDVNMGTAIIPNLDSIAEFRILTNNADAEYGEYSGGQINVITKSGTNDFHGDAFEFLRNTDLDARNYFSPARGVYQQNQFGGTLGGPFERQKLFFFADYQGTRLKQGIDSGLIAVPTLAERTGDIGTLPGTVTGPAWASCLSQQLGYTVTPGEPYASVFPGGVIPQSVWSAPAKNLLQYVPAPNQSRNFFSTSAFDETLGDDKGALRMDANTRWGLIAGYYFMDYYSQNNPYPTAQGGANVPGFNALNTGRAQMLGLGDTKTFSTATVNEFHFSYLRDATDLGKPVGGVGVSLASQGFVTGAGTPGIVALSPKTEGVETVGFNTFTIGTNPNELKQVNNTFQWIDNFSKIAGAHTIKIGVEFHADEINVFPIAQFNGAFLFFGSETGSDFADFLLGVPSQYNQSELQSFYGRNKYTGLFAEDSWRVSSSFTLTYGLRWDRIEPWFEKYNQLSAFVPGRQSVVFPGAPAGILFPTDPGVPRTLAPPGNRDFAPRIGLAYSPSVERDTLLGKILGDPGKTSFRAGFGIYYTAIEALTLSVLSANAPYGTTYTSPEPPLFATPFVTASTGQDLGQHFPAQLAPLNSSASHPDPNIDWTQYEPISGIPGYSTTNRIPYVEQYMFSVQRQLSSTTLLSASYVGTQSHRLLVLVEANPGNSALCLSLSEPSDVLPGTPTCGPFGESNVYTAASGQVIDGTRGPLGTNFGSDTNQATLGNSTYNALQLGLRHSSARLQFFAGYTFSRSVDQSSNLGEEVNPINPALSKALSAFDVRHDFVASYNYDLPVESIFRAHNRWTEGWAVSGVTRFSTGFPVTLFNYGDNSLLGAEPNGINNYGVDEPDFTPGLLEINRDPRNGQPYFNTSLFSLQPLGTPGNAPRRFFHGPGINNFDLALLKTLRIRESVSLQFRLEGFNAFNHAQFYGPTSVDGNINSATFGDVVSAAPPRLMQGAIKLQF